MPRSRPAPDLSTEDEVALKQLVKFEPVERFLAHPYPEKKPLVEGLLHRRDLVAFAARRRQGKTTFLTNLAIDMAVPEPTFLGYPIAQSAQSLLLLLEDDPRELQDKIKRQMGTRSVQQRIAVRTREDLYAYDVPIDVRDEKFQYVVWKWAEIQKPDLIVFDNLAHLINAEYSDPTRVHQLMKYCYELASVNDAAIVLAAHPRKEHPNDQGRISLQEDPQAFFESIMGTSHFVNSTGSLWAMERDDEKSLFIGGRQRGDGYQQHSYIQLDDDARFQLLSNFDVDLTLALNTPARQQAWGLLPEPPATFAYTKAQTLVKPALSSRSSFAEWMALCRRLKVILDTDGGKLVKAGGKTKRGGTRRARFAKPAA